MSLKCNPCYERPMLRKATHATEPVYRSTGTNLPKDVRCKVRNTAAEAATFRILAQLEKLVSKMDPVTGIHDSIKACNIHIFSAVLEHVTPAQLTIVQTSSARFYTK
ncbi:hypothetical protein BPOR_0052g00050 [Botrytis porri]|uniref:Uncharacterized protein n=1 Tax=Botrytis porri TaxID=87229 RepID=A0A4Z1L1N7_9HELO|nr:hypothetical protein BPOR_0052g00050 [Botrytis porri]